MSIIHNSVSHPCLNLLSQAVNILRLIAQLFSCAVHLQFELSHTDELLINFWALERAAHVQEAVCRLSEKIVDIPAGRVTAIKGALCVMDAAQRRQSQLNDLVPPQPDISMNIVVVDRRTIRHVLKLLDLATQDLGEGENRSHRLDPNADADCLSVGDTASEACRYLQSAWFSGAVKGGLINELCFSRGLAKIVTKYSAGEGGGEGDSLACAVLGIVTSTMQALRNSTDAIYQDKLRDAMCALVRGVFPQEGSLNPREGISTELLCSLSQTVMEAVRQSAAVQKLRAVPLTSRSKAIQKALSGGYLQVRANCTPRLMSFHQSLTALSSLQHSVLCNEMYPRIKPDLEYLKGMI